MNAASLRRPLGCLKTSLRQQTTRQQRPFRRLMATATQTPSNTSSSSPSPSATVALPPHTYYGIPTTKQRKAYRTGFAVYTPPGLARPSTTDPLRRVHAAQMAAMDPTGARSRLFDRHSPHSAKVGDVLMVTTRRAAEPFAGVCISIRRAGIETAVLLRTAMTKVGVEMWFKVYSRNVVAIDVVQRKARRARRARLTFMRKPKHDRGSVDQIVLAWRKSRNVFRTKGAAAKLAKSAAAAKAAGKGKKK